MLLSFRNILVFSVGYTLGAHAGRERYEEIAALARFIQKQAANSSAFQKASDQLRTSLDHLPPRVRKPAQGVWLRRTASATPVDLMAERANWSGPPASGPYVGLSDMTTPDSGAATHVPDSVTHDFEEGRS